MKKMVMKNINIDGFEIGGNKTFIIADVGSNHMQDLSIAKESIDAVAESGANAVKFQSIQTEKLYLNPDLKTKKFIDTLAFPEEWHIELSNYAKNKNITFFSSPTYIEAIDLLEDIDVSLYKLASAQIGTFPQLVEKVAKLNKPTIFSTGISSFENTDAAVNLFKNCGNDQFMILHCNSIYPTPSEKVNLELINTYKERYQVPVGFSDHTIGVHTALAAVAMGAEIIEKHFTLDRNFKAPDSNEFASDPLELTMLVKQISEARAAISGIDKRATIQPEEEAFKNSIRYGMVAKIDLTKGKTLEVEDFNYLRTAKGIDCKDFYFEKGTKVLIQAIKKGHILTINDYKISD